MVGFPTAVYETKEHEAMGSPRHRTRFGTMIPLVAHAIVCV